MSEANPSQTCSVAEWPRADLGAEAESHTTDTSNEALSLPPPLSSFIRSRETER